MIFTPNDEKPDFENPVSGVYFHGKVPQALRE